MEIRVIEKNVIYENPTPQLKSKHSYFPFVQQLEDGSLLSSHVIGEAFESIDQNTRLSKSTDMGKTWKLLQPVYTKANQHIPANDYMKLTNIGGGELLLFGYEFFRENPDLPLGNPDTGGILPDRLICLRSHDYGNNWDRPFEISCRWNNQVEASAPITVLNNGDWVTPITGFPSWDGKIPQYNCGRLLRSNNHGKTWNDNTVIIEFPGNSISIYEQRMCQLNKSGAIVAISWNEDLITGKRLPNHYSISYDHGYTFNGPHSTEIMGQASSVTSIGKDRLLALHSLRRDTGRPGIYGYIVNLEKGGWNIEYETILWEPLMPVTRNSKMAEIFAFLKFGQPLAIMLDDGTFIMTHWAVEDGQGKTFCTRLGITVD